MCEVCLREEHKYVCPGCAMKTCSLPCVQLHKKTTSCNGKRKVIDFVKLAHYTEKNLLDDLNFLESTSRSIKDSDVSSFRKPHEQGGSVSMRSPSGSNVHCSQMILAKLTKTAALRNVRLRLAPFLTTRRKRNSTYCNSGNVYKVNKHTKMFWHVQWICEGHRFDQTSLDENVILEDALELLSNSVELQRKTATKDETCGETCSFGKSLHVKALQEPADKEGPIIGMLAEHLNKETAIYRLDNKLSIRDNLRGKTVVEHPVFIFIPIDKLSSYDIIG